MASIKNLKKELIYTYGALLDQCYLVQMLFPGADPKAAESLCDEIEDAYVNSLKGLSRKADAGQAQRAAAVRKEFEATAAALSAKIEALAEQKKA